ncbi:hypothetical protein [Segetibacter aerophilus]|uniref:Uncharacterized protein n=1 Tax=Segetibacter aerophilus TaxID=670293 RepID=A0A512BDI4_9BACT|nr:hypothetical protein [Segetibacter aerophilus]GEO10028.1 hypothetical protein SAE01_25240 [Segetibacter aerophilus]
MSSQNSQRKNSLAKVEKVRDLQLIKRQDTFERVWGNIEKILDQFDEDLLRGKEELMLVDNGTINTDYFNWDIKAQKNAG